jgi:hypothetical protein
MTPTTGMLDGQQACIDKGISLLGAFGNASPSPAAQAYLDEAEDELALAQEALDAAKEALEEVPPDTATAKTKLNESLEHTKKALQAIRNALAN